MKKTLLLLIILLPVMLAASVGITFEFANGHITTDGIDSFYEFDIMCYASATGTKLGTGIVLIQYNQAAFGTEVQRLGNFFVTAGTLTNSPFYILILNDNQLTRVAITFECAIDNYGTPLPTTPTQLVHVKMRFAGPYQCAVLSFGSVLMQGQQYYDDNETLYDPVIADSSVDETLPVELSSFTAWINSTNKVSLNWITQSETGVVGYSIYRSDTEALESAALISPQISATNTSQMQSYLYDDNEIYAEGTYYYWLENADLDGTRTYHGPIILEYHPIGLPNTPPIIPAQGINGVFPNPFNPNTTISYGLDTRSSVTLEIFNNRGQKVKDLVPFTSLEAGSYSATWNGLDNFGSLCPSGVYLVRMTTGSKVSTRRITLIK